MTNRITIALALSLALAPAAAADEFFGLEHDPVGDADLVEVPDGFDVVDLGVLGLDGFDTHLPPPPPPSRRVWEGVVEGLNNPGADVTARVAARAPDEFGVVIDACSMVVYLTAVDPHVAFDFAPASPVTLGARYFYEGDLVFEETGLPVVDAQLPLPGAWIELGKGISVHYDYETQEWALDGWLPLERTMGGDDIPQCDHWEVFTEGATDVVGPPVAVRMTFAGVPSVTVTDERVTDTPICPGDLDGSGVVDVGDMLALVGSWGACSECAADLNGDGVIDVADLLALLGAWGSCP